MVSNRISEGVGKKIVEALKKQSDIEIQNVVENPAPIVEETPLMQETPVSEPEFLIPAEEQPQFEEYKPAQTLEPHNSQSVSKQQNQNINIEPVVQQTQSFTVPPQMSFSQPQKISVPPIREQETFAEDLEGFEIPTNIAVLKQLINQLPAGVSRQTGAQIIKQTMEALGISMKSVLQEAQQVQESLNNSARECQNSIMEYRKQIAVLEKQANKYQKQYSALNDIISLFVQTNI